MSGANCTVIRPVSSKTAPKPSVKIRASGGGTLSIEFDETPAGPLRNVRTTVEVERIAEGTLDQDWLARRGFQF